MGGCLDPNPGGKLGDLAGGVSRPTPGGVQGHTRPRGCIPACTEPDTPPQQTATAAGGMHPT